MTPQEARDRVLKAVPDAFCTGYGWLTGQVHIIVRTPSGIEYLSEEFPKFHDGHDEECDCVSESGIDEAWLSAANSDRVKQFYKEA